MFFLKERFSLFSFGFLSGPRADVIWHPAFMGLNLAGSTRRQAAVDSKFKLFFPKGGKPGEDVKAARSKWRCCQLVQLAANLKSL